MACSRSRPGTAAFGSAADPRFPERYDCDLRAFLGGAFPRAVVDARPVDGIMRAARESGADLRVMGTHDRSGWNCLLLGSVTERVLRETTTPVLTVRPSS